MLTIKICIQFISILCYANITTERLVQLWNYLERMLLNRTAESLFAGQTSRPVALRIGTLDELACFARSATEWRRARPIAVGRSLY